MSNEWKTKLMHSGQTASAMLNIFALVFVFTPLGVAVPAVLRMVGIIVLIDFIAEMAKLIFLPHNTDPKKSKWEGFARGMSLCFNVFALIVIFFPTGMTAAAALTLAGVIILIDFVIEVVEWYLMK